MSTRKSPGVDELQRQFLEQIRALDLSAEEFSLLPPEQQAIVREIVGLQEKLVTTYKQQGYSSYVPQHHQEPFHSSQVSTRAFIGANKMGKTIAINNEIKWFAFGTHPYRDVGRIGPIWVCCPSDEKSESYQQPQLEKIIGPENIRRKYRSPRPKWQLTNGNWIYFKNYSQDVATFASDEIRLIAYDEEPPQDIWDEGWLRRSADFDLDIVMTCTPTKGLTWIWPRIIDNSPGNDQLLPDMEWFGGSDHHDDHHELETEEKDAQADYDHM